MKFGADVVLQAATNYQVQAKTSSASQISLFSLATTNWSCYLRTTTSSAVGAGDTFINIGQDYLSAGSSTAASITMNETATTIYGATTAVATALVTPGIAITQGGTFSFSTSIAAYLKIADSIVVYSGGTYSKGTSGARIGASSSAILEFSCAVNVDYGLVFRNLSTGNDYGDTGRTTVTTLMTADKAATSTVITVASTAGWVAGDELSFAATTRTASECEKKTILTVDSATQVTLTAGLTNAHSGTSPTQAEVNNLTRNSKTRGVSSSLQGYIDIKATATFNTDYAEFTQMGSATALKLGMTCATTTGTTSITHCSFHDSTVVGSQGLNISSVSGSNITFSNNVTYNIANFHFLNVATTGTQTIDTNVFMRTTDAVALCSITGVLNNWTNNVTVGANGVGMSFLGGGVIGTISGNLSHSCNGAGMNGNGLFGTVSNTTVWRSAGVGLSNFAGSDMTWSTLTAFGNTTTNLAFSSGNFKIISGVISGDTTFATTNGIIYTANSGTNLWIYNSTFGHVAGIKTAHTNDINVAGGTPNVIILNNTTLESATEVASQTSLLPSSYISSQDHDQTVGAHKTWMRYGTLDIASPTVTGMTNPVLRMLPTSATFKLESAPPNLGMKAAVATGTTMTISVDIYKVAAYNGNQPRLIVRRNDAIGITADAVIDTATVGTGTAETLTGSVTATGGGNFTDDGTCEFNAYCKSHNFKILV